MSVVTDIILCFSLGEDRIEGAKTVDDRFPLVDEINAWLMEDGRGELTRLNGHEGGGKGWQCEIFGGAFNYLDVRAFVKMIAALKWNRPHQVQLFIRGEEDEVFGLLNIIAPYESRLASYETRIARKALGRGDEDEPWL